MSSKNRWAPLKKALDEINQDATQQSEWDAHLIIPGLFLGNERSSRNLNWLTKNKIQVIITVNLDVFHHFGIDHHFIPVPDLASVKIDQFFARSYKWIHEALQKGKNVLVHCHMGISRSAAIVCSYLIRSRNLSFDDALKFIKSKRSFASPNYGFKEQLKKFQKQTQTDNQNRCRKQMIRSLYHLLPKHNIQTVLCYFMK